MVAEATALAAAAGLAPIADVSFALFDELKGPLGSPCTMGVGPGAAQVAFGVCYHTHMMSQSHPSVANIAVSVGSKVFDIDLESWEFDFAWWVGAQKLIVDKGCLSNC